MTTTDWTLWDGGECPVPNAKLVDVKSENGEILPSIAAESIDWSSEGDNDDIVAYRKAASMQYQRAEDNEQTH